MKYLGILLLLILPMFASAKEAVDIAANPEIEKRMIALAQNVRCLVCQNESLAGSHAELAEDLRREIREQMIKGMSDEQIIDYLVERYGDFVLYDPPVKNTTLLLWYGPFILLLAAAGFLFYGLRQRKQQLLTEASAEPIDEAQLKKAAAMLNDTAEPSTTSLDNSKKDLK